MYGPPFTASPGALPLFLASLNKPKARVPYPSRAWEPTHSCVEEAFKPRKRVHLFFSGF